MKGMESNKLSKYFYLYNAFNDCPLVPINGMQFIINSLTEQVPATHPRVLANAAQAITELGDFNRATKIVSEEEKGAILAAAVSLQTGLPLGMARWYPSGLDGQIVVPFACEYHSGNLFLNGIEAGDKVIIVDDMISTGGTLIGLIEAVKSVGAEIVDIVCLAEKVEYNGAARVKAETGYDIKSVVKVSVHGRRSSVLSIL